MHGNGIYTLSGTKLFGKPLFSFNTTVSIPRRISGSVNSGTTEISFMPCFPPFESLIPQSDTSLFATQVQDMIRDCQIITNFTSDSGITQGCYNVTYNRASWNIVLEDYLLNKNLTGIIPGDALGAIDNFFTLHHTVCDNPSVPDDITTFSINVTGVGIYSGHMIIDCL